MIKSYKPSRSFTKVSNKLLDGFIEHIGPMAGIVYIYYARLVNQKIDRAFPALQTTAKKCGMSKSSVVRCNKILTKVGLIVIEKGGGKAHNRYIVRRPSMTMLERYIEEK